MKDSNNTSNLAVSKVDHSSGQQQLSLSQESLNNRCSCCCNVRCWGKKKSCCSNGKMQKDASQNHHRTSCYVLSSEEKDILSEKKEQYNARKRRSRLNAFRSAFWTLIVMLSVVSGGFFLNNNTSEFLNATVQTTLDGSVPLSEVFFPSVVVCNINQIRKSFFAELGFYENDTLVRIMYEDFIKGTVEAERAERSRYESNDDPKRTAFYEVN